MPTGLPPIIPGLTQTAEPSDPSGGGGILGPLLAALLGGGLGGGSAAGSTGLDSLREAITALHAAAKADPRLEDRVAEAIDVLLGETEDEGRESGMGNGGLPPSIAGGAKTPI